MPTQHQILSLVFNDVEAIDLFSTLGAIVPYSDYYTLQLVNIHNLSAPNGLETSLKNGIGIRPHLSLAEAIENGDNFDTLFIPGGFGMMPLLTDPMLLRRIGQLVDRAANVFSVCTGSVLLAATGRLNGRKATTNKRLYNEMTPRYTAVQWQRKARWVQDGKFLSSSGVTAGIDAAFAFLSSTFVSPEDRESNPGSQEVSADGEAMTIPGFNKEKALTHARSTAFILEYRWSSDPTDDPFVNIPQEM